MASSPAIARGLVYFAKVGAKLVGLEVESGQERAKFVPDNES